MATTYNKSLASDFGGSWNQTQLRKEIENEGGIAPTLTSINLGDPTADDIKITFDAALSAGEQTTLDGLISAHVPVTSNDTSSSSTTTFSTTKTTWQVKSQLDSKYLEAGDYRIAWHYIFCTEHPTPNIRIIVDDTTVIHNNNQQTPIVSSTYEFEKTGFVLLTLTEGQHIIKLQCQGKTDASITIKRAYMHITSD